MSETMPFRLLCVLAHPDDESLGAGGILAKYARQGVETYLVTATRGERGWQGEPSANPGCDALGKMREQELRCAARVLNVRELHFLNYLDGDVARAEPHTAISEIASYLRQIRPHIVITFGPDGAYGHPDHIAVSQFTTAAIIAAADALYPLAGTPHRVSKFYYMVWTAQEISAYQAVFGEFAFEVEHVLRRGVVWQDWAITTRLDTSAYTSTVWEAVQCHASQLLPVRERLDNISAAEHAHLWGTRALYRVFSLVNGGAQLETDLFEGLRE